MIIIHFIFLSFSILFSLEADRCSVSGDELYNISFCRKLEIRNIRSNKKSFSFPSDEWKERKYRNIFTDRREVYDLIVRTIKNCGEIKSYNCDIDFRLIEFVRLNSSSRVANAVISFDGLNAVFGVVKKNNFYIVFPPSNFVFVDKEYKKKVFKYIIDLWLEKEKI